MAIMPARRPVRTTLNGLTGIYGSVAYWRGTGYTREEPRPPRPLLLLLPGQRQYAAHDGSGLEPPAPLSTSSGGGVVGGYRSGITHCHEEQVRRGTGRGTGGAESPAFCAQWWHSRVVSVQVAGTGLGSMLLVSGRSAVRIRSPAPSSVRVFRTSVQTFRGTNLRRRI